MADTFLIGACRNARGRSAIVLGTIWNNVEPLFVQIFLELRPLSTHVERMPRYFLNVTNGERIEDPDGEELPDLASAHEAAILTARDLVIEGIRTGEGMGLSRQMEIVDEAGTVLEQICFAEAMPQDGKSP